jgi:hypothetical protein
MKTVVIWDQLDADLKFFVVDGDLGRFDKKYVNSPDISDEEQSELSSLVYGEDGAIKVELRSNFPTEEILQGARVIVAGFLP